MKAINNNNEVAIKTFIFYCNNRKEYSRNIVINKKRVAGHPK